MPAADMAAYLSLAVPWPPLMMAPAWPMRRPGGRGLSGDEADDGLFHVGLDELGGAFFGVAADFADQDDGVSVGVVIEKRDGVEEGGADDGVAADADAGRLADAEARELVDGFIGEGAAAADDADVTLLVDAAGHDADLAFAGRDDAGTVGADEARFLEVRRQRRRAPCREPECLR